MCDLTWLPGPELDAPRAGMSGAVLRDGRYLFVGPGSRCSLFDPKAGTWADAPDVPGPGLWRTVVALEDGRAVSVADGEAEVFVFFPERGEWVQNKHSLAKRRTGAAVLPLTECTVLVAGGRDAQRALSSSEILHIGVLPRPPEPVVLVPADAAVGVSTTPEISGTAADVGFPGRETVSVEITITTDAQIDAGDPPIAEDLVVPVTANAWAWTPPDALAPGEYHLDVWADNDLYRSQLGSHTTFTVGTGAVGTPGDGGDAGDAGGSTEDYSDKGDGDCGCC